MRRQAAATSPVYPIAVAAARSLPPPPACTLSDFFSGSLVSRRKRLFSLKGNGGDRD